VRVRVRACVRACVRAFVRACVRACVRVWEIEWEGGGIELVDGLIFKARGNGSPAGCMCV